MTPYLLQKATFCQIDNPLFQYAKNVTSQAGEDGVIEKIFEIIPPTNKYCAEFGGWDGKHFSNCYNLIANQDWAGCFIESNETKFSELLNNHGTNPKVSCVNKFVDFEGENSLDNIFEAVQAPKEFDFLSIDVDGIDYFMWEGLEKFTPRVIVIEFNPTVPNDIIFVQPKDATINQGCSLLALILLGRKKGYELICCSPSNAFFVKAELYPAFNLNRNDIWTMYQPIMDGRIFHGYDSYVYVCGMPFLIWSKIPLNAENFQVLPPERRRFHDAQNSPQES